MKKKASKKTEITLETLAIMVANGFTSLGGRMDNLEGEMNGFGKRMDGFENLLKGTNNRIDDLAENRATKKEVYSLDMRLEKVEKKLGMKK